MADKSNIEWTDSTWNPVTGCNKISSGCKNCYAERLAKRLKNMHAKRYKNAFSLTIHPDLLDLPLKWKKPRTVFVNSMSDLFHEDVPSYFIKQIFSMMKTASWHCFQILTKRAERLSKLAPDLDWPSNVWMGVSIEAQNYIYRVDYLRTVPASVRFLSIEPLLSRISNLKLDGIDWVIVGGESGPNSRRIDPSWVREIRDTCINAEVAFFFKQWGGTRKKTTGRLLDGIKWDQKPKPNRRILPNEILNFDQTGDHCR